MLHELRNASLTVASMIAAATLFLTPTTQASEVLPSPEDCVEYQESIAYGDRTVVITNGCPAPVLILYIGRTTYSNGDMAHTVTPGFSLMSAAQGETFEERLNETYYNPEACDPQNPHWPSCEIDVLQPGQATARDSVEDDRGFEWAVCAQYHPLSLDAASGPRECDVNPAFFMPNTPEARHSLCNPPWWPDPLVSLERCFRGR